MADVSEIWETYQATLRGFLLRRLPNAADVDDVLQDILLKTHAALPQLDETQNMRALLFAVARNAVTDHYRRSASRHDPHPDDLWYGDTDDGAARRDLEQCLEPFIAALPAAQAELLRAVELGEQSQKDYAAAHGLPYSTLKSQTAKARADLRATFERCCALQIGGRGNVADYRPKSNGCEKC